MGVAAKLPVISPRTFSGVRTRGFMDSSGYKTRDMPATTAGGSNAAATATPAILSEIFLERAHMVANP
jgi:hypothetical protein